MATPDRERLAKQLLNHHEIEPRHAFKPTSAKPKKTTLGSGRPIRHHKQLHRLPSPTEEQLERREQGWNDRFTRDTPSQPKRPARTHRANDEVTDRHDQKERKIRNEREQYGHSEAPKHQRPSIGRLVPIAPLSLPPKEPEAASSKEEKLRFNVLKAIDTRETLIYQLNALILCTPVQEAIVMAAPRASNGSQAQIKPKATMAIAPGMTASSHGHGSAMSNAREATRLAQQLSSDLQFAGIQVVEGIVEWMLEAGAKADKPPEFLWRGRNYFHKMQNDLDFAAPELHARGVELDSFAKGNPLCVRPDQRLGRVLAAQSIIKEMVEMARSQKPTNEKAVLTDGGDPKKSGRRERAPEPSSHNEPSKPVGAPIYNDKPHHQTSADEMIVASTAVDDYEDDAFASARSGASNDVAPTSESPLSRLRDLETEKELVSILDESFCEVPAQPASPYVDESAKLSERSDKGSARYEYENSFDGEEGGDLKRLIDDETEGATVAHKITPSSGEQQQLDDQLPSSINENGASVIGDLHAGEQAGHKEDDVPVDSDAAWNRAAVILQSASAPGTDISGEKLKASATWLVTRREELHATVKNASWSEAENVVQGSFLHVLGAIWSNTERLHATVSSLWSEQHIVDLKLPVHLWEECLAVVDEVCGGLALSLQSDLKELSLSASEVDIADVVEATETLLDRDELRGLLQLVRHATEVMVELQSAQDAKAGPAGLSKLVQVFYPYLANQRRDKMVYSWDRIASLFDSRCHIRVGDLASLLDTPCRILLLNVAYLRRISEEQDDGDGVSVPKFTIVCDRANLLETSMESVAKKCLSSDDATKQLPSHQLFPFFRSSFGEKTVEGVRVEEGEGKGPLKEWFTLIAKDLTAKWRAVELPVGASDDFDPVLINGNKLVVDRLDPWLKPGYKIEWCSPTDGATVSRIINQCDSSNGAYLLDRGGIPNHSFNVTELRVFQPRTMYLEYIQASESYWLNEAVTDTLTDRQVLQFMGWLFANALVHQCALQLRVHQLLFELLLDVQRVVTLQDLKSLDPSLFTAMEQLQHMKPAEFASYVEFEGLSPLLSVDDYTAQTIGQKYGSQSTIAWQLHEMRRGFHRVFSVLDLQSSHVSPIDLSDYLCGDSRDGIDTDFDIGEVFHVSLDPDLAKCEPLRRCFWDAVNGFDPRLKRKFIKFITGVDTLPQTGTEFLRIEMPFPAVSPIECERTLHLLPQSHTCDNTLELPNYWRALCWKAKHDADQPSERVEMELLAVLHQKLRLAAEYSSGYGLDGTKFTGGSLVGILPGSVAAKAAGAEPLDIQDSYESLDLPGLGGDSVAEEDGESGKRAPLQADEPLPLETTDMRQSNQDDEVPEVDERPRGSDGGGATTDRTMDEEEYGAEDWDEEELAE